MNWLERIVEDMKRRGIEDVVPHFSARDSVWFRSTDDSVSYEAELTGEGTGGMRVARILVHHRDAL